MFCFFKVINIVDIFKLRKYVVVFFILFLLLIEIFVNNFVFVLFGIIILVNFKSDLGNLIVGVGFNIVVIFCLWVILNVCFIVLNGILSCVIIKFVLINVFVFILILVVFNVIFVLL